VLRTRALAPLRIVALAGLALQGGTNRAGAGEVPQSALSRSLGLEPELLERSSLVFQFPQTAMSFDAVRDRFPGSPSGALPFETREPPSLLFASTDGEELAMGGIGRRGSLGLFVLSQRAFQPAAFNTRSTVLQAGTAAQWGGLRLGAAIRGSRDREEDAYVTNYENQDSGDGTQHVQDFLEYAFGLGIDLGGAALDVVLELPRQSFQIASIRISPDTTAIQLSSDAGDAWAGAARVRIPLGERLEWITAGAYREGALEWSGRSFVDSRLRFVRFGTTALDWSVASTLVSTTPYVDRVFVAGAYTRSNIPGLDPNFNELERTEERDRVASITVAAAHAIRPSLSAQVSVSKQYAYDRLDTDEMRLDFSGPYRTQRTRRTERFTDRFAWGLVWEWRRFELASSLSTTLDFFDLFAVLDVRLDL
jgi:hypothetical protein